MKTKFILPLVLLLVSLTALAQKTSEYKPQVDAVFTMLNTKKVSAAQSVLAESYSISKIFPGIEAQVLPQVLEQLPKFDSYEIISETKENGNTRVAVDFIIKADNFRYPANFLITAKDNKIQELNLLEQAEVSTAFGGN